MRFGGCMAAYIVNLADGSGLQPCPIASRLSLVPKKNYPTNKWKAALLLCILQREARPFPMEVGNCMSQPQKLLPSMRCILTLDNQGRVSGCIGWGGFSKVGSPLPRRRGRRRGGKGELQVLTLVDRACPNSSVRATGLHALDIKLFFG